MPSIIITVDYELPGNGSGDVKNSVIEPTERLLKILDSRKIKMTVLPVSFLALSRAKNKGG